MPLLMKRDWNVHRGLLYGTLLLVVFGLVMVFSTSVQISQAKFGSPHYLFYKQLAYAAVGLFMLFSVIQIPLSAIRNAWTVGALVGLTVVALAWVFLQSPINGTHRWIHLAGVSFQPSEFAKIAVIVFLAWYISLKGEIREKPTGHIVRSGSVAALAIGLIVVEPDLGNAFIIGLVTCLIWFLAGVPIRHLFVTCVFSGMLMALVIACWPYMQKRMIVFLFPSSAAHALGREYQITQSLIAVGHSGFWGTGLGGSTQKLFFLPEPHTDFIYSVMAEELGFLGSVLLGGLFVYLFYQGIRISSRCQNAFGRWLGTGLVSLLMIESLINASMVLAIGPTKGIPLPFISMGGTSLVVNLLSMGLVINVSREVAE